MKVLRRILCVPIAGSAAIVCGFGWAALFPRAYFSTHHPLYAVVGLTPSLVGRMLPVALFVALATIIAPRPGRLSIACFGLLGGVLGAPFGLQYKVSPAGSVFYLVEVAGAIVGAGAGVMIGLRMARRKKAEKQSPETNALPSQ